VPIKYSGDAVLQREIIFNGVTYQVGVPVMVPVEGLSERPAGIVPVCSDQV
jgi:hypothetical protein